MALVKCPDCGKELSDQAVSCPNCGRPITTPTTQNPTNPRRFNPLAMILGGILTVGIIIVTSMTIIFFNEYQKNEPSREVTNLIKEIGEVTLDSEEKINRAEFAYDELDENQMEKVKNHEELLNAKWKYKKLKKEAQIQEIIGEWDYYSLILTSGLTFYDIGGHLSVSSASFDIEMGTEYKALMTWEYYCDWGDSFVYKLAGGEQDIAIYNPKNPSVLLLYSGVYFHDGQLIPKKDSYHTHEFHRLSYGRQ